MSTTILLYKCRDSFGWAYIYDNVRYEMSSHGGLLPQIVDVLTRIRDTHELFDEDVVVCSTAFVKSVFYDLTLIFPMWKMVPIVDNDIATIFNKVMLKSEAPVRSTKVNKTLYICSDASKGANSDLAGWAWFSSVNGRKSYNFGVSSQYSIVDAEFEGILHAIVDNAETESETIHVYCDSMRSVEFAEAMLDGKLHRLKTFKSVRIQKLMREAMVVAASKKVVVQWVKGHRSHRLNMGADFISRKARVSSERGKKLSKLDVEISAIVHMFP